MRQVNLFTKSAFQTRKLGKKLAEKILKKELKRKPLLLFLEGELGSGKTAFVQGFAKGLGIGEKILSPTFVLIKKYPLKNMSYKSFYHIDCYRLKKLKDLLDLGFEEIISNSQNIVALEWADKLKITLRKHPIKIKFKFINKNKRHILISF
jgi:tRNA threonylcarbamoyladenosine biosynthesis protein TsaE